VAQVSTLCAVAPRNPRKKVVSALEALDALDGAGDQLELLDAARRLREAAEELEVAQLRTARRAGATWGVIGACYGLTKQGAQQRFRRAEEKTVAATPTAKADKPGPAGVSKSK
jgi:hypothetical protein